MEIVSAASKVARFLTTKHESKKHGGYDIYEDEKIRIACDTYVPNVHVNVNIDGNWTLAMLYNGAHGHMQEIHSGAWEGYVLKNLLPKALQAEKEAIERREKREAEERAKRNARLNDSHIFAG